MKVVGVLEKPSDWDAAQQKLTAAFNLPRIDQMYLGAKGAKLLPITTRVRFGEESRFTMLGNVRNATQVAGS